MSMRVYLAKSLVVSTLLSTCFYASSVSAATVKEVLKEYYPLYNSASQCQGVIANSGSVNGLTDEPYLTGYCMSIDRQVEVKTPQGRRLYILVTGDNRFDENGDESLSGHAYSGHVGMFVLKPQNKGWQIESANNNMNAGASGQGLQGWKLIAVAPNKWGFVNEHSDVHQGYLESSLIILTPAGNSIVESMINSQFSDAATGQCGESDQPKCEDITAKLHQVDTGEVVNGFYPLKLMVTGNKDGKTYKNKIYSSYYKTGKGYQMPTGYPLKND